MRATLRALSARLIVGHLDSDQAAELLSVIDPRDKPVTFALAEPDGLAAAVPAGGGAEVTRPEPVRWGKLVLETVGNEVQASPRRDVCDSVVDGLRVAHRRLGGDGLELIPKGCSGVGFCSASITDEVAQIVVVPPAQIFVVHQGVALGIPEGEQVGRGIWMRDDLRAEIFAGIGGAHEPDIRVYEATVSPGDTLVLASSELARMLTEDDVRLAVTYEEASTAAERLKQLAIQRGVEAGLALVVEISGSFTENAGDEAAAAQPGLRAGLPLHLEMPPIGSIFSTARDWLLEAVDRVQDVSAAPSGDTQRRPGDQEEIIWPTRPQPGAWRADLPSGRIGINRGGARPAPTDHVRAASTIAVPAVEEPDYELPTRSAGSTRAYAPLGSSGYARSGGPGKMALAMPRMSLSTLESTVATVRARISGMLRPLQARAGNVQLAGHRNLLVPVASAVFVILVVIGAMKTVKAQQARQLQQRFDSLITAAGQLETQASGTSDRLEAQGLVRRSQALLDQAGTLTPGEPRIAKLRTQLQTDLDRLDNIYSLPEPVMLTNFGSLAKDVRTSGLAADASALYALDSGGQRVLQFLREPKQAGSAAVAGDSAGRNVLGVPKLMTVRDSGLLILDSNRTLWSYSAPKHALEQVGLKSSDSWKEASALAAFGPNVYILDATVGNVFRYGSRDGIFTEAPSRFLEKDNHDLLAQGTSLSVDGSVWILNNDGSILKLASGANQAFSVHGLPQPLGKGAQLYTNADQQSLYVLDGANSRVVQIAKDGRYVRQLRYRLDNPATGFWPDEAGRKLALLSNNTIYQYDISG